jgi:hypothetical protein
MPSAKYRCTSLAALLPAAIVALAALAAGPPPIDEGLKPREAADTARLQEVLNDTQIGKHWVYDDLAVAVAKARQSQKPLLVEFR